MPSSHYTCTFSSFGRKKVECHLNWADAEFVSWYSLHCLFMLSVLIIAVESVCVRRNRWPVNYKSKVYVLSTCICNLLARCQKKLFELLWVQISSKYFVQVFETFFLKFNRTHIVSHIHTWNHKIKWFVKLI